jgi:hypothetical protein
MKPFLGANLDQSKELSEVQGYISLLAPDKPFIVIMWARKEDLDLGPIYGCHSPQFFVDADAARDCLMKYADQWSKE